MTGNKVTRATFKAFVAKNRDRLLIRNRSDFDPMTDCVQDCFDKGWRKAQPATNSDESYDLGINGIWLVGHSRDWFQAFTDGDLTGIDVSNCCGSFAVAVRN